MSDFYSILGVAKNATADDIKRSYRRLASQHHPDKGGDVKKFQEIEEAYRILSDPSKREEYDNPQRQTNFHFSQAPFNFDEIFAQFGTRFGQQSRPAQTARATVPITLLDIARGAKKLINISTPAGSNNIEITIPQGIEDGDQVNYGNIAPGGIDLVIVFRVMTDPIWQRRGADLTTKKDLSIWDLILGGSFCIDDILGNTLEMAIPPNAQPGTVLRVKGRGLKARMGAVGDMLVTLNAKIPTVIAPEIIDAIRANRDR